MKRGFSIYNVERKNPCNKNSKLTLLYTEIQQTERGNMQPYRNAERKRMMGTFLTMAALSRISSFVEHQDVVGVTASFNILSGLFVLVVVLAVCGIVRLFMRSQNPRSSRGFLFVNSVVRSVGTNNIRSSLCLCVLSFGS